MVRDTWVHSSVESYQRLKKWYLMPPCLTPIIIRYDQGYEGVNPFLHLGVVAKKNVASWSLSTTVGQSIDMYIYICVCVCVCVCVYE